MSIVAAVVFAFFTEIIKNLSDFGLLQYLRWLFIRHFSPFCHFSRYTLAAHTNALLNRMPVDYWAIGRKQIHTLVDT